MIANRNVNIIMDADGKRLVLINDIRFKGKRNIDWDDVLVRYNVFRGQLLINHAENGNKYLYDILAIKKETRNPQQ